MFKNNILFQEIKQIFINIFLIVNIVDVIMQIQNLNYTKSRR